MASASRCHNLVTLNTAAALHTQLRQRPCEVYSSDLRVRIRTDYVYPDVVVVCGSAEFEDKHGDSLLNPTLIIEVLSPTTEQYDRGRKFRTYRLLDSLREYVLITQDSAQVESYTRQSDGRWLLAETSGLTTAIELTSIGCTLQLADVYDKVSFTQTEVPPPLSPTPSESDPPSP